MYIYAHTLHDNAHIIDLKVNIIQVKSGFGSNNKWQSKQRFILF